MKTVKQVSEITGISIRTLRYYDQIGLLKPTKLTDASYRLYDNKALEKLQKIMFFRELEIPLENIKRIMDDPSLDKMQILSAQKSMLEKKRNRLNGIIELISDVMKGENTMNFEEFDKSDMQSIIDNLKNELSKEDFNNFIQEHGGGSMSAFQEKLEQTINDDMTRTSLLKWYGSKEKVIEGSKPVQNMDDLRKELDELHKEFFQYIEVEERQEEHRLVEKLAELYKKMLNMDNVRNFLIDLSKEYLQGGKIAEVQDEQYGKGTTKYMGESIQRYYGV